ncbi:hypothetical protein Tco_1036309 [Tanacetum coccineum]
MDRSSLMVIPHQGATRYDSLLSILSIRIFFNSNFITGGAKLDTSFGGLMNSPLVVLKTDAKFGSVDGGFVASVVGGRVGVDCPVVEGSKEVKDGYDFGMTVVNHWVGEDSMIIKTSTVRSIGV